MGKAIPVYEQWKQEYPSDPTPRTNLGNIYMNLGNIQASLAQHRDALRAEPNGVLIYENLSLVYYDLNRFDEATAMVQEAFARKMDDANLHLMLLQIAFLRVTRLRSSGNVLGHRQAGRRRRVSCHQKQTWKGRRPIVKAGN
jgi:tetratricopeptide (TPR) repeat protein